jgi:hypothetical protein
VLIFVIIQLWHETNTRWIEQRRETGNQENERVEQPHVAGRATSAITATSTSRPTSAIIIARR